MRANNEISLPQHDTVMHATPDTVQRHAESYIAKSRYCGKLHIGSIALPYSAVTRMAATRYNVHSYLSLGMSNTVKGNINDSRHRTYFFAKGQCSKIVTITVTYYFIWIEKQ